MTTIRDIVVATDFSPVSDAAVERARQLAEAHEAALWLLHASPHGADSPDPRLDLAAASLAARGGRPVLAHPGSGDPAPAIREFVGTRAGALVVVGSRADPALAGLGSTASAVVRLPTCPVLVVRALATVPYRTVLSAVDLRQGSVRAASFAIELLPAARHQLLYALEADPGTGRWKQAESELRQLAARLGTGRSSPVHAVVADDVPERAILVAAANLSADCVVVGHHGHGPATVAELGSMAQHVVHSALSDVLVVP